MERPRGRRGARICRDARDPLVLFPIAKTIALQTPKSRRIALSGSGFGLYSCDFHRREIPLRRRLSNQAKFMPVRLARMGLAE